MLVTSIFLFSHNVLKRLFPPVRQKSYVFKLQNKSFEKKKLWEKEKLLVTTNFSFSHHAFFLCGELSSIFIMNERNPCGRCKGHISDQLVRKFVLVRSDFCHLGSWTRSLGQIKEITCGYSRSHIYCPGDNIGQNECPWWKVLWVWIWFTGVGWGS